MTKLEIAKILVKSPVWDGIKNADKLSKLLTKQELQDAYDMMDKAEEEYYNTIY